MDCMYREAKNLPRAYYQQHSFFFLFSFEHRAN